MPHKRVHINQIILSVPGSSSDPAPFDVDLTIGAGLARWWRQPADYLAAVGSSPTLRLPFFAEGNATATSIVRTMVAHANPPSGGAYRFWAGPDDLRPDEFWRADGTAHPQDNPAQLAPLSTSRP